MAIPEISSTFDTLKDIMAQKKQLNVVPKEISHVVGVIPLALLLDHLSTFLIFNLQFTKCPYKSITKR